ncbi:MAG: TraR/DksA C4-type zinc finger protein [Candidatus Campbellbacteria bacterium]|nr:TraR/DksA C4-type zinc finger protein [Candidatus Campbellbacteria bacterium]
MEQEQIKEIIIKEIAKTERLINEYREMSQPVAPDDAIGRITRMDAINNKSVTEASLRQAEEKLKNLNRVLSKIGTKEFGICQKCGKEIHIRRIIFRPESLLCVDCAN